MTEKQAREWHKEFHYISNDDMKSIEYEDRFIKIGKEKGYIEQLDIERYKEYIDLFDKRNVSESDFFHVIKLANNAIKELQDKIEHLESSKTE